MFESILKNVENQKPIIHCITNYVTVNDVANIILASKASPIMADEEDEVEEITSLCSGLNINMGTLNKRKVPSMIKSGKIANQLNHPVVLDPVGVGASQLRKQTAFYLLENIHFSVIKGNISEIKVLASHTGIVKGVDAAIEDKVTEENLENTISFIKKLAKKMNCIIVASGEIDLVSDNQRCFVIRNGESKMSSITGTGCQLSALITSYISANKERMLEATVAAVCTMGLAGEIGKKHLLSYEGNATYRNRIIDAVDHMDEKILEEGAKYEIR